MQNNSDEVNIKDKIKNLFQKENQNELNLDQSKKNNNIITEPLELRNVDNKPIFTRKSFNFSLKIKIIFITIYFIFTIGIEFFYRELLFNESIILQEYIHRNHKNLIILKISTIISFFGAEFAAIFFSLLIFLFMPLNYSIVIFQCVIYSAYFTNTMKMIYQSDRPYWRSNILTFSCARGYGNPSGHSFNCINMYLCLWHIFTKYFKIKGVLKLLIFTFCILLSLLIIISRVILAAHSINQILYGTCLGIGTYFILIHIIGYHKYTSIEFYQHIKKKNVKKKYYIIHIFLLLLSVFIYLFSENKDHKEIDEKIFNGIRCKKLPEFKRYKNDGLFQAMSITAMIGAQFGIDILFILLKNNNYMINYTIIEWNKNNKIKFFFLRFFIICISAIRILFYFLFPGFFAIIGVISVKGGFAFFFAMAGIYSLGIFICIQLKIANKDIYKMDALHEITAEA